MSFEKFKSTFHTDAEQTLFSPGRVNLIGEHIDYCGGLVMPMAIDRGTYAWVARSETPTLSIYSERFAELARLDLNAHQPNGQWTDFAIGVMTLLRERYSLVGLKMYVTDDIDAGGLSSSASFSLLIARSLLWAIGETLEADADRIELAKLCQQVEHEFIGVQCGIMDQASIALGGVMTFHCEDFSFQRLPHIPEEFELVVMNTRHPRDLAGSKYNERVAELAEIKQQLNLSENLCTISPSELGALLPRLNSSTLARRLHHVVTENQRVTDAATALVAGDYSSLGQLMNASHDSLHHDYEVTGEALAQIVDISRRQQGCIGARMSGAGFGGCALALVEAKHVSRHNQAVQRDYFEVTGVSPELFSVQAVG